MSPAGRCRLRFVLPFSSVLVLLAFSASVGTLALPKPPSPLLGVDPREEEYFAAEIIACKDGTKSFRRDRLNDGFCDCPDGTDEPGTSACPEGKFYCRNIGDTPRLLFSSRVNDHICDCCDGSDENDGSIICPNTCSKDPDFFKGSTSDDSSEGRKLSQMYSKENKKRDDSEDLILRLKELRLAVFLELFITACVIASCLFLRRARSRRRQWYRN